MDSKKFCRVVAVVILVFGIIGSFFIAYSYGVTFPDSGSSYKLYAASPERDWAVTIGIFFGGIVSVCIISSLLLAVARIIENQENIYYCLKQIERGMGTQKGKNVTSMNSEDTPPSGFWKCSKCGIVNANYVGTCACGESKY